MTMLKSRAEDQWFLKGSNDGHRAEKKCTIKRLAWNVDRLLIWNAYITFEFDRSVSERYLINLTSRSFSFHNRRDFTNDLIAASCSPPRPRTETTG